MVQAKRAGEGVAKGGVYKGEGYKGLVLVVYAAIGTKSEGPHYLLQVSDREFYILHKNKQNLWEWDRELEKFSRRFVEVNGKATPVKEHSYYSKAADYLPTGMGIIGVIEVETIVDIGGQNFPR